MRFFTTLLLLASLSPAPALHAKDLWTGPMTINTVQVVDNGGFIIKMDQEINPLCTYAGSDTLFIYPYKNGVNQSGIKSLLSTALIAFTSELKVNIMYDDSTMYCWGRYLSITR
jgi:hypothetical protein